MELSDFFFYCYTTSPEGQGACLNFSFWLIWMIVVLLFAIVISPWSQQYQAFSTKIQVCWTQSPDVPNEVLFFKNNLNSVPLTLALSHTHTHTHTHKQTNSELWNSRRCCSNKIPKMMIEGCQPFYSGHLVFISIVQSTNCYFGMPEMICKVYINLL